MLYLIIELSNNYYALNSKEILEIIPNIILTDVSNSPDFVSGIFNYRGTTVPVLDLSIMTGGKKTTNKLSSKILIVNYNPIKNVEKIIGLLCENILGTKNIENSEIESNGLNIEDAQFLSNVYNSKDSMIQLINVNKLLTKEAEKVLFTEME